MPHPSQNLREALAATVNRANGLVQFSNPRAVSELGRFLDSLIIVSGPEAKAISSSSGSGSVGGGISVIAGDGLAGGGPISSDVTLTVGAGDGITVNANDVAVNATVARNTWAVNAGAGLTGGGNLASGGITLNIGAGTGITVNANDVQIDQGFTPTWTGAHVWSNSATFNGTAAFTSIASNIIPSATDTYDLGSSTKLWRKGWLSELDAVLFAQNVISVVGGWLIVSKGEGVLGADLGSAVGDTTANLGTTANITAHATTGDIIVMRAAGAVEYIKVTAGSGPTWTVTRDLDGSGRNAWPAGTVFVNLGYNGTGRIELNASDTPRISIIRQGTTYNAQTELIRIGDLNGWGPFVAEQYGWAVGDYSGGNYAYYGPASGFRVSAGGGGVTIDGSGVLFSNGVSGSAKAFWGALSGRGANVGGQNVSSNDYDLQLWANNSLSFPSNVATFVDIASSTSLGYMFSVAQFAGASATVAFGISSSTLDASFFNNLTVSGGLNVGTATSAGTGEIRASSHIRAGNSGTAQTSTGFKMMAPTVANNGTTQIFATNDKGWVFIIDDANVNAIFEIRGNSNGVSLVSDPQTLYATTSTANRTSIEASGSGVYTLRNRRGAGHDYSILLIGRF